MFRRIKPEKRRNTNKKNITPIKLYTYVKFSFASMLTIELSCEKTSLHFNFLMKTSNQMLFFIYI